MVCLDTSFLIALIRRQPDAEKKLEEYTAAKARLTTTSITACELFKGAYKIIKVKRILAYLEILEFSVEACERYGNIVNELELKGSPIGDLDTMIASIAITHREPLVTSNKTHFERIPGLILDFWQKPT